MLPASTHYQERAVDMACLLPPPRREVDVAASDHNQTRAVDVA